MEIDEHLKYTLYVSLFAISHLFPLTLFAAYNSTLALVPESQWYHAAPQITSSKLASLSSAAAKIGPER